MGADLTERQFYIIPKDVADKLARKDKPTAKTANERYWPQDKTDERFRAFARNFCLSRCGY